MEAAFTAATDLYNELSAKNPRFKKVYDNWRRRGQFRQLMAPQSAAN